MERSITKSDYFFCISIVFFVATFCVTANYFAWRMYATMSLQFNDYELPAILSLVGELMPYSWLLSFGAVLFPATFLATKKFRSILCVFYIGLFINLAVIWIVNVMIALNIFHVFTMHSTSCLQCKASEQLTIPHSQQQFEKELSAEDSDDL